MLNFDHLKDLFLDNNRFLITTHVNPDADAIGSEIVLNILLNELSKDVKIVNRSETPYSLKFLDKENKIETFDPAVHKNIFNETDLIIAVDFNRSERLSKIILSIRHARKFASITTRIQKKFLIMNLLIPPIARPGI